MVTVVDPHNCVNCCRAKSPIAAGVVPAFIISLLFVPVLYALSAAGPVGPLRPASRRHVLSTGAYAAMCTVVKDQQHDIREFIDYHHWIGFEKFYVYDNNSTQDLRAVLADYIEQGLVEHFITLGKKSYNQYPATPQHTAYRRCIKRHRLKHKWLAFFDVDEFLHIRDADPSRPPDVRTFLPAYACHAGLAVSWVMFGSSGHEVRANASTLTSYTKCIASGSYHVKTIANTRYVRAPGHTPHTFKYLPGYSAVNECFQPVHSARTNFSGDRIVLLHYVIKSKAEFAEKSTRGGGSNLKPKSLAFFNAMDSAANDTCLLAVERGRQFEECCFAGPGALRPRGAAAAPGGAARRMHGAP
jgi:hypothetical protein